MTGGDLFTDWCASWDIEPLSVDADTVVRFMRECPAAPATLARRVRHINAIHEHAGLPAPGRDEAVRRHIRAVAGRAADPISRFDDAQVTAALEAVSIHGWPRGMSGRRDAAVVALVCRAGLTRRQVSELRVGSLDIGGGEVRRLPGPVGQLSRSETSSHCPVCACTRWLRLAAYGHAHGWRGTREWLADDFAAATADPAAHDCETPLPDLAPHIRHPLVMGFDQHGWPLRQPLSMRSVTAIIAARLNAAEAQDADPPRASVERPGRDAYRAMERLLDEFEEQLAVADRRLNEAMDALDRSLDELSLRESPKPA